MFDLMASELDKTKYSDNIIISNTKDIIDH